LTKLAGHGSHGQARHVRLLTVTGNEIGSNTVPTSSATVTRCQSSTVRTTPPRGIKAN